MKKTPKSLRLHIALFGRTNAGKSSFLNMIAGQDVAITSSVAGTTTDIVEKTMELLPLGPVLFLDTAGLSDKSALAAQRIKKTKKVFDQADIMILLAESGIWNHYEEDIVLEAKHRKIPLIIVINKIDLKIPSKTFLKKIKKKTKRFFLCCSVDKDKRNFYVSTLKKYLIEVCPDDFLSPPPLIGDLLPSGSSCILIVPIDMEAPKGRLILPQVQTIRDALDNDASALIVKEREYPVLLNNLKNAPAIVVCDSQVVLKMVADTPVNIKCTTFSILFSRYKGDLIEAVKGAAQINNLKPDDKILIAEACSHHALEDDIGRVKIPRWLKQYVGTDLDIKVYAGKDYPDNLGEYKLIIHCGGCMLNRRQMLSRIQKAREHEVPITNYGVCISMLHGVLEKVLSPFPAALDVLKRNKVEK